MEDPFILIHSFIIPDKDFTFIFRSHCHSYLNRCLSLLDFLYHALNAYCNLGVGRLIGYLF